MSTSLERMFTILRGGHIDDTEPSDYLGGHASEVVRIIIFFSIVTAGTGVWACFQSIDPFMIEGNISLYKMPGKILLFTGASLLTTSIVSIIEVGRLTRVATVCVIRAIFCALLLETIAGAIAISLSSSVSSGFFNRSLLESVKERYGVDKFITWATNDIQKTYKCCGINGPEDWNSSFWKMQDEDLGDHMHYPSTCCKGGRGHCNDRKVHKKGCGFLASRALYSRLKWNYICAFSSILIHVTSLLLLSFLQCKV